MMICILFVVIVAVLALFLFFCVRIIHGLCDCVFTRAKARSFNDPEGVRGDVPSVVLLLQLTLVGTSSVVWSTPAVIIDR